ncbi:four helix bundle protein [bacterium]|nr:four helix bundle protein [bacterium]
MGRQVTRVQDLTVWKRGFQLVKEIYLLTARFPSDEKFGLTSQMRRAAVSIPANIAEGFGRNSRKDFARFSSIALGSAREVETLLMLAVEINLVSRDASGKCMALNDECCRMLNAMRSNLNAQS